jgi:LacI family transcriptional regulator
MAYLKKSKQSRFISTIGILNAYDSMQQLKEDSYTRQLIKGATQRADALGYAIDYLHLAEPGMTPRRLDQIIAARGIQGLLIPPEPDPLFKVELDWSQIAAVATTTTAQPLNLHRVLPNNFHNIRLLLDQIVDAGYERIGLIIWDVLEQRQMHATASLYALYAHIEKRIKPLKVHQWNWQEAEAIKQKRMAKWLDANRPELILGFGRPCIDTIRESTGQRIPEDLAFASYGDTDPQFSRIEQDPEKVGAAAIDMLSAHIQRGDTGVPESSKTTLIDGHFVRGDTLPKKL